MSKNKKKTLVYDYESKKTKVRLDVTIYDYNKNLYVGLTTGRHDEYYCDITVNLDEKLDPYCGYVNNYDPGQDGIEQFLSQYHLASQQEKQELPVLSFSPCINLILKY